MAEMLVDGAKLDACLDAEADAIRAKTGGSTDLTFDFANNKGFADAIDSIQTGGGLPQGMTHIGSGSYTFASQTSSDTPINHNLDFTPKAVMIWTTDSVGANTVLGCFLERQLFVNEGSYKSIRLLACKVNTSYGEELLTYGSTDADVFITSTTFNIGHGSKRYSVGATYNWFAWA